MSNIRTANKHHKRAVDRQAKSKLAAKVDVAAAKPAKAAAKA